jgi:hypothetical protein
MNLVHILKRAEKLAVDNSPAILTAFGIAGVVSTAVLAGKASIKAFMLYEDNLTFAEAHQETPPETKDVIRLVWKLYIPAASSGLLTIAAIVGSNHVSTRRATAMAAVYSISEKAFVEYKDKVVERLGEKKEQSFRDEIAQDRVKNNPVNENTVIITDGGEVLCYDHFTGRYFKSSMEAIKKAQNDINYQILHDGYASVSDLFDILGLPVTSYSEEVGWNQDRMLDIAFSTVLSEDNRPCISIDFDLSPNRKFSHFADED